MMESKEIYFGEEAEKNHDMLDLVNPIEGGVIKHWDEIEAIWEQVFKQDMRIDTQEFNILVTDTPAMSKLNREKMIQMYFEEF